MSCGDKIQPGKEILKNLDTSQKELEMYKEENQNLQNLIENILQENKKLLKEE